MFRSLRDVIHTKRTTRSEVVNPRSVKDAVAKSAAMFVGNEQQDAHEFFSSCMAQVRAPPLLSCRPLSVSASERSSRPRCCCVARCSSRKSCCRAHVRW